MNRKFYIVSTGGAYEEYTPENFKRCLIENAHIMSNFTKEKKAWYEVNQHDIIILKHCNNLVAYGKVTTKESHSRTLEEKYGEWNWGIFVEQWFQSKDGGVRYDGIKNYINSGGHQATVREIKKEFAIKKIEAINNNNTLINSLNMEYQLKDYLCLVESNHNIILTGAPGTGKTYLAREIAGFVVSGNIASIDASTIKKILKEGLKITSSNENTTYEIVSISDKSIEISGDSIKGYKISINRIIEAYHNKLWDGRVQNGDDPYRAAVAKYIFENNEDLRPIEIAQNEQIGFVQFHPSYDYTDFVEGLRAEKNDNKVTFTLKNGIFKEFCKKAIQQPDKKFVFIIDEINRGEISKIFGELFFSIDPGYRIEQSKKHKEICIKTQYANLQSGDTIFDAELGIGYFYVPNNVYIIGTMNDIDRSVESMDFAMRRRFTWVEIKASEQARMLNKQLETELAIKAIAKMTAVNEVIDSIESLNAAYHIGPAYFLKIENYQDKENKWASLWNYHLLPLIVEYLRGMPNMEEDIKKIKDAYDTATLTKSEEVENKKLDESAG